MYIYIYSLRGTRPEVPQSFQEPLAASLTTFDVDCLMKAVAMLKTLRGLAAWSLIAAPFWVLAYDLSKLSNIFQLTHLHIMFIVTLVWIPSCWHMPSSPSQCCRERKREQCRKFQHVQPCSNSIPIESQLPMRTQKYHMCTTIQAQQTSTCLNTCFSRTNPRSCYEITVKQCSTVSFK